MKPFVYSLLLLGLISCASCSRNNADRYDDGYLNGPVIDYETFPQSLTGTLRIYYQKLCSDNDYIYALYTGNVDMDKEMYGYSDLLYVFDWEANPVAQINLPTKINNIVLDSENSILYGMSEIDETIYRIDFPKLN